MNVGKLLRQPYPVPESTGSEWVIGAFVGGFLLVFQPFGMADWETDDRILKILGFGAITTGVMLAFSAVVQGLPRYFAESHWTVGKEIAKILLMILCIAVANRLYMSWLMNWSWRGGWLVVLGMTFLIGLFPTVGMVLINYIVQLRRYEQQASRLTIHGHPPADIPAPVPPTDVPSTVAGEQVKAASLTLTADNEKDALRLDRSDLLAIESSDNYCTVYRRRNGGLAKELMRSSLSRLENQLAAQLSADGPIVRCHRSYVVNLEQVERVSGNAQGYKLHLLGGQLTVPVARKYNDTLVAGLK